jgi:hypothetical protein
MAIDNLRIVRADKMNRVHFNGAIDAKCFDDPPQATNLFEHDFGSGHLAFDSATTNLPRRVATSKPP